MNWFRKNHPFEKRTLWVRWKVNSWQQALALTNFFLTAFMIFQGIGGAAENVPKPESLLEVSYPIKRFENGRAQFFQQKTDEGITVRYFILKTSDGVIRSAFDACDVCWPAGKGYKQEGEFMICRNCGMKFLTARVNEIKGGCSPAPLARQIVQDRLVIQMNEILQGKRYFNFSKRSPK